LIFASYRTSLSPLKAIKRDAACKDYLLFTAVAFFSYPPAQNSIADIFHTQKRKHRRLEKEFNPRVMKRIEEEKYNEKANPKGCGE